MTVTCNGAQCTIVATELIASGTSNFFEANFVFDSSWNTLTKYVFFVKDSYNIKTLLSSSSCKIPSEVTATPGDLYIGLSGVIVDDESTPSTDETVIITTPYVFAITIMQGVIIA